MSSGPDGTTALTKSKPTEELPSIILRDAPLADDATKATTKADTIEEKMIRMILTTKPVTIKTQRDHRMIIFGVNTPFIDAQDLDWSV